jgi:hypothetical protein
MNQFVVRKRNICGAGERNGGEEYQEREFHNVE